MQMNNRGRVKDRILIALVGLALCASLHCSKDEVEEEARSTDTLCQENEGRCEGDMIMLCRMGEWQAWENCAALHGECRSDEGSATCEVIPVEDTDTDTSTQDTDSSTQSTGDTDT